MSNTHTAAEPLPLVSAKAAGLKVVRILTISEGGGYSPQPPIMYARAAMADMVASAPPVEAGELTLGSGVTVTFVLGR